MNSVTDKIFIRYPGEKKMKSLTKLYLNKTYAPSFVLLTIWIVVLTNISFGQFQNIQINSDTLTTCNEPGIAVNPLNPLNIVVGANNTYFFSTFDGGITWTEGKMYSSYGVWGDPSLAFDLNGNLYFSHLSGEPPLSGRWADRIVIQKSTDGGLTWSDGTYAGLNRPKHEDKDWLIVDLVSPSYKNNLYVAWTEFDKLFEPDTSYKSRIMFSRSTDAGETWSPGLSISDVEGNCLDDDSTTEGASSRYWSRWRNLCCVGWSGRDCNGQII